jgi:hypothetical protein
MNGEELNNLNMKKIKELKKSFLLVKNTSKLYNKIFTKDLN